MFSKTPLKKCVKGFGDACGLLNEYKIDTTLSKNGNRRLQVGKSCVSQNYTMLDYQ